LSTGGGNFDSGSFLDNLNQGTNQTALQAYVKTISNWLAYFGEVSSSCTPMTLDCPSAIAYFSAFHGAMFKMIGNDAAPYVNSWTSGGCFTQIQNQLGYWIQLDSVSHQGTANRGDSITVSAQLRNLGWSRVFTPRRLVASACLTTSPYTCYTGTSNADLRLLPPQATSSVSIDIGLAIPSTAAPGTYALQLSIPDAWPTTQSRPFMVRFGNSDSGSQAWNDSTGAMSSGTSIQVN
jgi:hypothetical protein